MEEPTNLSEIQSFLEMINYCNRIISDFSTVTALIRHLTKKNTDFKWDKPKQETFTTLKTFFTNAPVLAFYNPNDASPHGLGAIFTQKQQGELKPIAYESRTLTETESRYSQTELKALAVIWYCQYFHYYVHLQLLQAKSHLKCYYCQNPIHLRESNDGFFDFKHII